MSPVSVNLPSTAPSSVKSAEVLRILMPIIIIIILYYAYTRFIKGMKDVVTDPLKEIGVMDTDAEKKAKAAAEKKLKILEQSGENPFNPNYYKTKQKNFNVKLLTGATADKVCKQIWDAIGRIYDSPENILGAMKTCTTKTQVSFVAARFAALHEGKDLLNWLEQKLDTTDQKIVLGKIIDYVNGLPVGKV